ncbi:hypothetical protein BDY24DRAFT_392683 [Mrakia frigida]|uniref:Nvj2p n=1 Tax=Mrakia frigida TaxID=29902 RepID=UPI003FCC05BF
MSSPSPLSTEDPPPPPPPPSSSLLGTVLGTVLEGTGWLETRYSLALSSSPLEALILVGLGVAGGLMLGGKWWVLGLLFGGPVLLLGTLYFLATSNTFSSTPIGDPDPFKAIKSQIDLSNPPTTTTTTTASPSRPIKLGTLIARRTFEETRSLPAGSTISASIAPFIKARATNVGGGGGGQQPILPPEQYYAKLSGDTLYLHKTVDARDGEAIGIGLKGWEVELWPRNTPDPELFAKRNAIRIHRPLLHPDVGGTSSASSSTPSLSETLGETGAGEERKGGLLNTMPWFFFVKSNSEMEDWYLALKHAASPRREESLLDTLAPVFSKEDMAQLVETLDTVPDPIHTRWLNGLFGRIFLGVNRTAWLENFITSRIQKKLNRLPLSPKLTPLIVTAVSFSSPPPTFSSPMLKDLTEDGEASMEVKLAYKGEVRISVSTTLTLVVPFSKEPKTWPMGLTIRVKDLEGDLLVMLKKPPSARLWYGFREMPKVSISVLPEFSTMKIRWGVLLSPIENQLKEIIAESVVLPNMDDIPWFDTTPFTRGGIFADAVKKETVEGRPGPTPDVPSEVLLETLVEATEGLPTNLRKRNGSSTLSSDSVDLNVVGLGINRVNTAPPDVETSSTKSTSSTSSYRSWLTGSRGRPAAVDVASLPAVGSSLREESSNAIASSSDSIASTDSSSPSTIIGGVVGVELARTNSAPDHVLADPDPSRSPPEPSQKSHMNRTGHQPALSTSSIPTPPSNGSSTNSSSTTVNVSTSPTTTMSILNNLRDKKSREEALAKGLKIAKGWQGMKEARSLWNRKVGDSSSNAAAPSTSDRIYDDESWHQRYVAEETSTISDKSDAPSLYAGSLFSRASKADTANTSPGGSPPHAPASDALLPLPPSPLLGRKRGDSAASNHSSDHHHHHASKPIPNYFDPYSSASKPSVSTTTVSTSKDGDEISSETPFRPLPPPTLRTNNSGSSSLVAVPPPSIPTTQLHVEPAPSLPSSAQTSSTTAAATGPATPSTRRPSSFSSPSQDERSPSSAAPPVRTQLSRSTMMRVPAIPKDRKAEQMSFGSTPPEEGDQHSSSLEQHPSRTTRLGSSIYQLVSGAGSKIQGISPSELPSTFHDESTPPAAATTPVEDRVVVVESVPESNQPPPLPDRPRPPARDIPPSPTHTQPDRPTPISTSSSTSTSPSATESLLSIAKLDRDRQTTSPQSSVPTTPVSSSFANTKTSEGFLIPSPKPPTLPPRKSFEIPPKSNASSSVAAGPLSSDHSSNVHAHVKGPPLPPRSSVAAATSTEEQQEKGEEGEGEGEEEAVVKPAMTRSRSDSEEKSQEGLFPLEG